jgi:hypothetical protein
MHMAAMPISTVPPGQVVQSGKDSTHAPRCRSFRAALALPGSAPCLSTPDSDHP